jgi:hypothetical protein
MIFSVSASPPLAHVILSPSRRAARGDSGGPCFNISVVHGEVSEGAQMIGLNVLVEGGASSSWSNVSWFIADVAIIYPVQVVMDSATVLVVGVPSLVPFQVISNASDLLLQMQFPVTDNEKDISHIVIEQKRPGDSDTAGLISVTCTSEAVLPSIFYFLFVAFSAGVAGPNNQQVVSRAYLNATCITSLINLQPPAASVLIDDSFAVKVSVVASAPPSTLEVTCDPALSLVSPPPVLLPLAITGNYESVFVLKCRFTPR